MGGAGVHRPGDRARLADHVGWLKSTAPASRVKTKRSVRGPGLKPPLSGPARVTPERSLSLSSVRFSFPVLRRCARPPSEPPPIGCGQEGEVGKGGWG